MQFICCFAGQTTNLYCLCWGEFVWTDGFGLWLEKRPLLVSKMHYYYLLQIHTEPWWVCLSVFLAYFNPLQEKSPFTNYPFHSILHCLLPGKLVYFSHHLLFCCHLFLVRFMSSVGCFAGHTSLLGTSQLLWFNIIVLIVMMSTAP